MHLRVESFSDCNILYLNSISSEMSLLMDFSANFSYFTDFKSSLRWYLDRNGISNDLAGTSKTARQSLSLIIS